MKKLFFVVALLAVVASCTKNEVIPQNDGNKEITYLTAPLTKAYSTFATSNRFYSYAYLLTSGIWKNDAGSSTPYINEAEIWYQTSLWKAAQSYYWPKNAGSSLTFFAWSNGTGTLDHTVGKCDNANGVQFENYDISIAANKNKDMMVAKIAADQKENKTPAVHYQEGVPTLFYHVLSSLEIKAKVAATYPDVTFKVKNITLKANSVKGSYTQGVDATKLPTAGTWTQPSPAVTANLQVYNNAGFTLDATVKDLEATADDYRILLPHAFTDTEEMQITYDIITEYTGSEVTETVTVSKKLSEIFTETTPASWVAGKKYTLTITLSMNEILWDPAVEEWTAGTGTWGI